MASYIITELLEEILVRVPIKSLLRFKSTCKRWRALIESASFVAFHARRHSLDHQNRLVFSRYDAQFNCAMYSSSAASSDHNLHLTTTPLFDFGYRPSSTLNKWPLDNNPLEDDADSPYITTLGPLTNTNGIYCIINNDRQRRNRISVATSKIALFNPATREYKFTNRFPFMEAAILTHQIARLPSLVNYGFGSVRSKSGILLDYKVVVIILSGHDHSHFLSFVYSLRRGSWKKIADVTYGARYSGDFEAVVGLVNKRGEVESPRFVDHEIVGCAQLFLNGSWHWLDALPNTDRYEDRVLLFDVANETFGLIGGPPHDYSSISDDGYMRSGVLLLNDHLAAVYLSHDVHNGGLCCVGLDVWMMMEYGVEESWTKVYSYQTAFDRLFSDVTGLCYSIKRAEEDHGDDNGNSNIVISINKIFLEDFYTAQFVSLDGCRVREHDFYLQNHDALWNTLGISTYVETLDSLTLVQ